MLDNRQIVGKCSQCGGVVSLPKVWMSVNRPVPTCERCHAVVDETAHLPVVETIPVHAMKVALTGTRRFCCKTLHQCAVVFR